MAGYKIPAGVGKDYPALVVLGDVLLNGDASRLYQGLVKGKELMLQVQGGVNFPFESPWRTGGPTLLSYFGLYKPGTDVKAVVDAAQQEIGKIAAGGVTAAELQRVKAKMRSDFYSDIELPINRADALALAQLIMGDANALNDVAVQIEAVSAATGDDADVIGALASLIEKSLVRQMDVARGEPRVMMLETIREFATEQLGRRPEAEDVHRAHATYYADLAGTLRGELYGEDHDTAMAMLTAELGNLRAAWRYWVGQSDLARLGQLLQAGREVEGASDRGILIQRQRADDDDAGSDADVNGEPAGTGGRQFGLGYADRRSYRPFRVVFVGSRIAKVSENGVAEISCDRSPISADDFAAAIPVRLNDFGELFGVEPQ